MFASRTRKVESDSTLQACRWPTISTISTQTDTLLASGSWVISKNCVSWLALGASIKIRTTQTVLGATFLALCIASQVIAVPAAFALVQIWWAFTSQAFWVACFAWSVDQEIVWITREAFWWSCWFAGKTWGWALETFLIIKIKPTETFQANFRVKIRAYFTSGLANSQNQNISNFEKHLTFTFGQLIAGHWRSAVFTVPRAQLAFILKKIKSLKTSFTDCGYWTFRTTGDFTLLAYSASGKQETLSALCACG